MGGWAVGLNDNNAILNSVDVVVEVGVELGNILPDKILLAMTNTAQALGSGKS